MVTIDENELAELKKKADQWDALGYVTSYVTPEDYEQVKRDAALWRKVKEIAERNWMIDPCDDCPVSERCDSADSLCGQADAVVNALKEAHDVKEG